MTDPSLKVYRKRRTAGVLIRAAVIILAVLVLLLILIILSSTMEEVFWSVFVIEVLGGLLNYMIGRWSLSRFRRFSCPSPAQ